MTVWQVSYRLKNGDEHTGYTYHARKREAQAAAAGASERCVCEIESSSVPVTVGGLLRALNRWGSHPDNG